MKSVSFFNNKGGVGKTTLACNIAAHFARVHKRRVILIDCDPQCNSTQLVIGEDAAARLYWPPDGAPRQSDTILDVVRPIQDGDATINAGVKPLRKNGNRFGVDVLPGHPRFSTIEDKLSEAWWGATGGDLGGIRKTNWCVTLCRALQRDYDVAFFDLGPSLGSINRSVLLGSDFFVSPMGCDIFSIIGIRNIADWLHQWIDLYKEGVKLCEKRTPNALTPYDIRSSVGVEHGFAGFTIQQYITKSKGGVRQPTKAFEHILQNFSGEVEKHLGPHFAPTVSVASMKLGDVPNMFSLIPLAQSVSAPIRELASADGLVGSQYRQAADYALVLDTLAANLARNLGLRP